MNEILEFYLILFTFIPLIFATIAFVISLVNFVKIYKIKKRCEIIDDNVVEVMRIIRDYIYESKNRNERKI